MDKPLVSVIIVSFNTQKITLDAIDSVAKHTKIPHEIIVVDNASSDGSTQALAKLKNIRLIAEQKNHGFGAANNLGAAIAQGKYLVFLNSDTLLQSDVITPAIDYLNNHPSTAAYSVRLANPDGSTQASGGFAPTLFRVLTWQLGLDDLPFVSKLFKPIHPHLWFYSKKRSLDWVTGAFMASPKKVFDQANGFDEKIFMYAEELELCYRLKLKNKKIIYDPAQSIIHLGGQSSGSVNSLVWEVKGIIYFFAKHKPGWQLPLVKILFLKGSLLRLIIFGFILNNPSKRTAYAQIIKDIFIDNKNPNLLRLGF